MPQAAPGVVRGHFIRWSQRSGSEFRHRRNGPNALVPHLPGSRVAARERLGPRFEKTSHATRVTEPMVETDGYHLAVVVICDLDSQGCIRSVRVERRRAEEEAGAKDGAPRTRGHVVVDQIEKLGGERSIESWCGPRHDFVQHRHAFVGADDREGAVAHAEPTGQHLERVEHGGERFGEVLDGRGLSEQQGHVHVEDEPEEALSWRQGDDRPAGAPCAPHDAHAGGFHAC
mmetsp:Transcript_40657/g.108788  ORF Transcript_40657/g.108788 Transcript_40657/m.108788 type:complete len:230 (+) Transcript_40657:776-1465(+)